MKVEDISLKVTYEIFDDLIEMEAQTNGLEEGTFKFSILDIDKKEGYTTIEFNNIEELEECINHFKKTFNKLKDEG